MAIGGIGHAQALIDAKADLADIIAKLLPGYASTATHAIMQTLNQRAQSGWLSNTLGVIV
jgi:hypothetical protein